MEESSEEKPSRELQAESIPEVEVEDRELKAALSALEWDIEALEWEMEPLDMEALELDIESPAGGTEGVFWGLAGDPSPTHCSNIVSMGHNMFPNLYRFLTSK